jgi:alpha-mannosidase
VFSVGKIWGGYDTVAWFRTRVLIPTGWHHHRLALRFLVGPLDGGGSTAETMLYVNGTPLQAIDVWHEDAWLPPEDMRSDEVQIALKAWSGVWMPPDTRRFKRAQLVWIDQPAERLYYLMNTLLKAVNVLNENELGRVRMVQALNDAYNCIDFAEPRSDRFYDSLASAYDTLREQVDALEQYHALKPRIIGIGHAHIDMAWLWQLRHTREKAARTFATALHLMRQYPDYRFMHSSPQLYKYLEYDYPDLFARVKERIDAGQWEITGATWVEPDINIPCGESLVRQFLFGRRYVRDRFDKEMSVLWLPDVFGYSYALP